MHHEIEHIVALGQLGNAIVVFIQALRPGFAVRLSKRLQVAVSTLCIFQLQRRAKLRAEVISHPQQQIPRLLGSIVQKILYRRQFYGLLAVFHAVIAVKAARVIDLGLVFFRLAGSGANRHVHGG